MEEKGKEISKGVYLTSTNRRKWDKEYFERLAEEREQGGSLLPSKTKTSSSSSAPSVPIVKHQSNVDLETPENFPSERAPLRARDFSHDFSQKIGKKHLSTPSLAQTSGFYCEVCDCSLKDSRAYLDHVNGRKHQKAMGISMRTLRATVDDVKSVLTKRKRESYDFEERIRQLKKEEAEKKEQQKLKKRAKKQSQKQEDVGSEYAEPDMAEFDLPMSFGSNRKK